jgi:hypothetical protein
VASGVTVGGDVLVGEGVLVGLGAVEEGRVDGAVDESTELISSPERVTAGARSLEEPQAANSESVASQQKAGMNVLFILFPPCRADVSTTRFYRRALRQISDF